MRSASDSVPFYRRLAGWIGGCKARKNKRRSFDRLRSLRMTIFFEWARMVSLPRMR